VLTFNAFAQTLDATTLTIENWNGSLAGGGADQLIFAGDPLAFQAVFDQSEIIFSGYTPGYSIINGAGTFEVVAPVPEPASLSLVAIGAMALLRRRRA
jgi:hypothetical protein